MGLYGRTSHGTLLSYSAGFRDLMHRWLPWFGCIKEPGLVHESRDGISELYRELPRPCDKTLSNDPIRVPVPNAEAFRRVSGLDTVLIFVPYVQNQTRHSRYNVPADLSSFLISELLLLV